MRRRNYMLVVFYDITPAIIAVVLLALVLIDGASTAILNTLGFLCLVLVIRSVFINLKRITKSGIILRTGRTKRHLKRSLSTASQEASYELLSEQFRLGLKNIVELMTSVECSFLFLKCFLH